MLNISNFFVYILKTLYLVSESTRDSYKISLISSSILVVIASNIVLVVGCLIALSRYLKTTLNLIVMLINLLYTTDRHSLYKEAKSCRIDLEI